MTLSRRDFLRMLGAGVAVAAVPTAAKLFVDAAQPGDVAELPEYRRRIWAVSSRAPIGYRVLFTDRNILAGTDILVIGSDSNRRLAIELSSDALTAPELPRVHAYLEVQRAVEEWRAEQIAAAHAAARDATLRNWQRYAQAHQPIFVG